MDLKNLYTSFDNDKDIRVFKEVLKEKRSDRFWHEFIKLFEQEQNML